MKYSVAIKDLVGKVKNVDSSNFMVNVASRVQVTNIFAEQFILH
jgi:hypothetical protein